jgi:hypothetical protein
MTLADLGVIVVGAALVLAIPAPGLGWPSYLAPPPPGYFVVVGSRRLVPEIGLVLALVVCFRRGRYGGMVRPAEWLALGLAALCLLENVPNLDAAVNAYYAAARSTALDFGVARWLLSAPAAVGFGLVAGGLALLLRRARSGSRVASALTVAGIVSAAFLWYWGPCEVVRLELPWLLVPSPNGDPRSWGWRGAVVFALREVVANGPMGLTWGLPAAVAVRTWSTNRRRGRTRAWVWTEPAAFATAAVAFGLYAMFGPRWPGDLVPWVSMVVSVGLASWWIAGCLGAGPESAPRAASLAG